MRRPFPQAVVRPSRSLDGAHSEVGSVTVFTAVAALGLLVLAGLVVDGGAKIRAVQRADRVAAEAARAAGQAVDLVGVLQDGDVRVDRRAALEAADAYLRQAQVEGSVSLMDGGAGIAVATRTTAPTVFLGLVGVPRFTVQGSAQAVLVHDPTRGIP